jgi:dTMP kinase
MVERGKFIVAEGGVGCGKTTVLELLKKELPSWHFSREPGGTEYGEKVRDAVQGIHGYTVDRYAALFGYSSSRANLIRGVIIPALKKGENYAVSRYWYSTFAYQGAEGVSKLLIWAVSMVATKGLKPNLILHFDVAPEIGSKRKDPNDPDLDRYDIMKNEFHLRVKRNYEILSKLYSPIWETVDASQPLTVVVDTTHQILKERGFII